MATSSLTIQHLGSDKIKIINSNTFDQILCQKNQNQINKKYKRFKEIPNLCEFIKVKPKQQKRLYKSSRKRIPSYAIYKTEKKKSVKKSTPKKKSKLKKTILKYRLLKRSQSLKELKVTTKLQNLTLEEVPNTKSIHSRRFREYCDNTTSQELSESVDKLLRKLNFFQKRAYQLNNIKAKSHRRIVVGFREVLVHQKINKIKGVIIATDCEKCDFEDGIDNLIEEIKENCKKSTVPCVFAMHRRQLSYVLFKKCPIACVGIVDFDGAQDEFLQMGQALEVEKTKYAQL